MRSLIAERWNGKKRYLPGINCIVYPDGKVVILRCYSLYNPNTDERTFFCEPLCDSTIDSIERYKTAPWVQVSPWTEIAYQGGTLYGGDGTMGNEGFIACADVDDRLLWGMFFENTNPIKSLSVQGRTLIAVNEHSELQVEVNLDNLTEIKLVALERR